MKDLHALEQKSSALSAILSETTDLIFIKDTEGRYVITNKSFELFMGLGREEIAGKTDIELFQNYTFHEDDLSVVSNKKTLRVEDEVFSPFLNENKLFDIIKTPVISNNDVTGILGIARDVTERKAVELAAQAASQVKSEFLSRMSHEIRTPLNAIIGMAKITQNSLDDRKKAAESISKLLLASDHLLAILNDVLDMSKIESGKFEIVDEPFSLDETINEISSIISQRCKDKYIQFISHVGELPKLQLRGDKLRIKQVLINLLGNAVKFTNNEGWIELSVKTIEDTAESIQLNFSVSDNGIGMTKEQLERLFSPFQQADNSISLRYGGTGLGLAISQNLVKLMGSKIDVESKVNEGSTFTFGLTLKKGGAPAKAEEKNIILEELDLTGKTILVVEDIEINRFILKDLLADTNVEIIEAETGREAVEKFIQSEPGRFNLIFMDIQMPEMDGYEATAIIRSLHRWDAEKIPIIAMTANAYQEDINRVMAAGMDGHIAKPIDIDLVIQVLSNTLTGSEKSSGYPAV
ncbi:MAG: response regulator [Spirochaetia bacterium]|nr:response regulator [Spirochaetia bacterium]